VSREIPAAIEAEESLLGAILLRPSLMKDLIAVVDPSDFYAPAHQAAYLAMCELHDRGRPIDPITLKAQAVGVEISDLLTYQNATPSITAYSAYADLVIEASRRRRMIARYSELIEDVYRGGDIEQILGSDVSADRLIAPRSAEIRDLWALDAFMGRANNIIDDRPWLLPGTIKALWRVILVAPEGWGKAVLMRFLAVHAAAGRDPWNPARFIEPSRVLYVDVENAESSIAHQVRISNRMMIVDIVSEAADNMHIWHREGGIDLRQRRTQAEFEAVLQKVRPQIVFAGPLYKMYRRKASEDMEQAALGFVEVLDDLRVRYGFAIMLEHHAPKGNGGGYREMNPFGSSLFMRWPEFGLTLEPVGHVDPTDDRYEMKVSRFRRDREVADWPDAIIRGAPQGNTPWIGRWDRGRGTKLTEA